MATKDAKDVEVVSRHELSVTVPGFPCKTSLGGENRIGNKG